MSSRNITQLQQMNEGRRLDEPGGRDEGDVHNLLGASWWSLVVPGAFISIEQTQDFDLGPVRSQESPWTGPARGEGQNGFYVKPNGIHPENVGVTSTGT